MDENYGILKIHLMELMRNAGYNKYKLSLKVGMNWKQIDSYCNNTITRLDTFVLCKLCKELDCNIQDLLEYIPPEIKSRS